MRTISTLAALALLAGLGACTPRDGADAPADTARVDGAAGDPVDLAAECVNESDGYRVRYPAGWQVNSGDIMSNCSLFHPGVIDVPIASEVPIEYAVHLDVEPVDFGTIAGEMRGRRTIARETTTVGGREAVRIDAETTGEGLHDRGIRHQLYAVNLGERTLTATTYDVGEPPFARRQEVLRQMMESLTFIR